MTDLEHNKGLVRRLVQIVNDRALDQTEEVASGQVARDAARGVGPFAESFPDFRMELVEVLAESDKVVGYFKCSGTQLGSWRGNTPTGRRFENIDEVYLFRVENAKLDSALAVVEDNLARMAQLGLAS